MSPQVLGEDFNPHKRKGRPPIVDITHFKRVVDSNPGSWVSDTFTFNEAQSVKRQFRMLGDYEVSVTKAEDPAKREVVVRRGE